MRKLIPPDRVADAPLAACGAPSDLGRPHLAPSPEQWPWWLRALIFAGLTPLVCVPFVPFVYEVTPWNEIVRSFRRSDLNFGFGFVAAQSLLGPILVLLSVRFLIGLAPGRVERGFAWFVATVASGFGAYWWVGMCIEIIDRWPILTEGRNDDRVLLAVFLVLPVALAIGCLWLWRWRGQLDRQVARLTVILRLAFVTDVGALVAMFGEFSRDIGWYAAVVSCGVIAVELALLGVSGSRARRSAPAAMAAGTREIEGPRPPPRE